MDWQQSTSYNSGKRNIFVVHGTDDLARLTLIEIVHSFNLNPIVLNSQANAGMTLIEKFEKYASSTQYAIVLLTTDDLGGENAVRGRTSYLNQDFSWVRQVETTCVVYTSEAQNFRLTYRGQYTYHIRRASMNVIGGLRQNLRMLDTLQNLIDLISTKVIQWK